MSISDSIPFFRYSTKLLPYEEELVEIVRDVMGRGAFILQEDLSRFERKLATFLEVGHVIGVGNGTDAILLALRALEVGPGDEVVLPSHTYVATAAAVHFVGATPVLVECGTDHLMEPQAVEAAITGRTRAMIPVHLNGRTCDMDALQKIAESHDLLIVEDAAQAVGSKFRGRCAGSFGSAATFSFYPAKVLGCLGDGGAVATDDPELAGNVCLLRDHGRDADGEVIAWGLNSRLDNLQAAILDFKLTRLELDIARRREIAARYDTAFREIEDLVLPPGPDDDDVHHDVYQNYEIESPDRDELRRHLADAGIATIVQWGGHAVHQLPGLGFDVRLSATEHLFDRCLLLPMNVTLTDEEVARIIMSVREFHGQRP